MPCIAGGEHSPHMCKHTHAIIRTYMGSSRHTNAQPHNREDDDDDDADDRAQSKRNPYTHYISYYIWMLRACGH